MNRPRELNRIPARVVCAALLVCAALVACTHGAARPSPAYGLVRGDAVEVCLPPGENIYLKALRCPDGAPPHVERQGSVGTSESGAVRGAAGARVRHARNLTSAEFCYSVRQLPTGAGGGGMSSSRVRPRLRLSAAMPTSFTSSRSRQPLSASE